MFIAAGYVKGGGGETSLFEVCFDFLVQDTVDVLGAYAEEEKRHLFIGLLPLDLSLRSVVPLLIDDRCDFGYKLKDRAGFCCELKPEPHLRVQHR